MKKRNDSKITMAALMMMAEPNGLTKSQPAVMATKRPSTSTGTQNTTTVAIAIRILAPHVLKRNCFRKMKKQTMITLALALTLAMPTMPAFAQKAYCSTSCAPSEGA